MPTLALSITLALLGFVGGTAAGLLGFGGGILMFPLLYYVPPIFGLDRIEAKVAAAIVITQVFFSTLIGGLAHLRSGRVHTRITWVAGITSAAGAFVGAIASKWASERFLLVLFGVVATSVLGMLLLPEPPGDRDQVNPKEIRAPMAPLAICSFVVGIVIGLLGAGNFVFVPLMIYLLKIPTRIAIGSSLFIAMINSALGMAGKFFSGQIPAVETLVVTVAAMIGALFGEKIHRFAPVNILRSAYAVLVAVVALRIWISILWY